MLIIIGLGNLKIFHISKTLKLTHTFMYYFMNDVFTMHWHLKFSFCLFIYHIISYLNHAHAFMSVIIFKYIIFLFPHRNLSYNFKICCIFLSYRTRILYLCPCFTCCNISRKYVLQLGIKLKKWRFLEVFTHSGIRLHKFCVFHYVCFLAFIP